MEPSVINRRLIELAFALRNERMVDAILICDDLSRESIYLINELVGEHSSIPVLLACRNYESIMKHLPKVIGFPIPIHPKTRMGQAKIALLVGLAKGHIQPSDSIVILTGIDQSSSIDTVVTLNLKNESEMISISQSVVVPEEIQPGVFEKVLGLAAQISMEGREGRPVGTIFVVGDSKRVLTHSRNLVMNPFLGYHELQRNVLDDALEETLKEYATIDGAFIVSGTGVVETAAAQLIVPCSSTVQERGLGTRHAVASAITETTNAISICISQSTGSISVFKKGALVAEFPRPSHEIHHTKS